MSEDRGMAAYKTHRLIDELRQEERSAILSQMEDLIAFGPRSQAEADYTRGVEAAIAIIERRASAAATCHAAKPMNFNTVVPTCAKSKGHDGPHQSEATWVPGNYLNALLRPEQGAWMGVRTWL